MRRLLWLLGLVELVWLIDNDGQHKLRIVRGIDPFWCVYTFDKYSKCQLLPNGKVAKWVPFVKEYRPFTGERIIS